MIQDQKTFTKRSRSTKPTDEFHNDNEYTNHISKLYNSSSGDVVNNYIKKVTECQSSTIDPKDDPTKFLKNEGVHILKNNQVAVNLYSKEQGTQLI